METFQVDEGLGRDDRLVANEADGASVDARRVRGHKKPKSTLTDTSGMFAFERRPQGLSRGESASMRRDLPLSVDRQSHRAVPLQTRRCSKVNSPG